MIQLERLQAEARSAQSVHEVTRLQQLLVNYHGQVRVVVHL